MKSVRVKKIELLDRVGKNRKAHRDRFLKALDGWKKEAVRVLEDAYESAKSGKLEDVRVFLQRPDDHTDEYDRAIEMLAMEVSDEVEIDADDFAHLVQDRWDWMSQFMTSTAYYLGKP